MYVYSHTQRGVEGWTEEEGNAVIETNECIFSFHLFSCHFPFHPFLLSPSSLSYLFVAVVLD